MIITSYNRPSEENLKGYVLHGLSTIEEEIEAEQQPSTFIDYERKFQSGIVTARFPKAAGTSRITNDIAMKVLGAAWQLQYIYGPRGFSRAEVEVGERTWGYFSLKIDTIIGVSVSVDKSR